MDLLDVDALEELLQKEDAQNKESQKKVEEPDKEARHDDQLKNHRS